MLKNVVTAVLALSAAALVTPARADVMGIFGFTYTDILTSGLTIEASGVLDVSCATFTSCVVTSITGERNGFAITSLLPANGYAGNDNGFFPYASFAGGYWFDFAGVSYTAADGNSYNLAWDGNSGYTDDSSLTDPGGSPETPILLTINQIGADIPEPASIAVLAAGIVSLGIGFRRRVARG